VAARSQDAAVAVRPGWDDDALSLIQLSGLVQGAFARVAERHDLTAVQGRLLCVLVRGSRGMADLARVFGVERAALTGLVDRVERRGLAERVAVPGDRRAVHVALTEAGVTSAAAFHEAVTAEVRDLLDPLTADERKQFLSSLSKLTRDAAAEWAPNRPC
jgi:DNA-binding MarR family transcriptional regulator